MEQTILKKLEWLINKNFTPPFVTDAKVEATLSNDGKRLTIQIQNRDVEIDENFNVLGAGTALYPTREN